MILEVLFLSTVPTSYLETSHSHQNILKPLSFHISLQYPSCDRCCKCFSINAFILYCFLENNNNNIVKKSDAFLIQCKPVMATDYFLDQKALPRSEEAAQDAGGGLPRAQWRLVTCRGTKAQWQSASQPLWGIWSGCRQKCCLFERSDDSRCTAVVTAMQRHFLAAALGSPPRSTVNALSASITTAHFFKRNPATRFHLLLIKACSAPRSHSSLTLEQAFTGAHPGCQSTKAALHCG